MSKKPKKVFVSGCFDLLHSGHIAFLKSASEFGEVYVSVGSDSTITGLKKRPTIYTEVERVYMLEALSCVKQVVIGSGSGFLDFQPELEELRPDVFVVNKDGDSQEKRDLCRRLGIEYRILERIPAQGLPARKTTELRSNFNIPYRIDLAGGWLDQPFVSKYYPGPVLTISLEPDHEFNLRSGMATSTRNKAIKLWGGILPKDDEETAKVLFAYENPPGTVEIAGSQDSIGIVMPNLNYSFYKGKYWPESIETVSDHRVLSNLESLIQLIPLTPRAGDFSVFDEIRVNREGAKRLSKAAQNCFQAIKNKDNKEIGKYIKESLEAQVAMFPRMINQKIINQINKYKDQVYGYKISGAGGGGYLILISDKRIRNSLKIRIRRSKEVQGEKSAFI